MKPGDIVSRRKFAVRHYGVVTDEGKIYHNEWLNGEHTSELDEFSKGRRTRVHEVDRVKRHRSRTALNRIDDDLDAPRYNLFTHNCEHTVTGIVDGKSSSPQLKSWIAGLGVAAVVLAATRHPGWAIGGFVAGKELYRKFKGGLPRR